MLQTLHIRNYALIEDLEVAFAGGLSIITGETGAGKSIIIDALGLILGERADSEAVRKGAEKAVVEGIFRLTMNGELKALLSENEIESADELILRREISAKGTSRCFINDTPATLAVLRQVGDQLVDLHGQHEHQSLLRTETHIDMLDEYGGLEGSVREFSAAYADALTLAKSIEELRSREHQLNERRALYEFQLKEIDAVDPQAGEEEKLEAERKLLENAEHLFSVTEELYQMLYEGDHAVHGQLVMARNRIEELSRIDPAFNDSNNEIVSGVAVVHELAKFIQSYNSRIEFNPERLEEIRARLGQLTILKKKYGGSLDALLSHRAAIAREIELAENFEEEIARREKQLAVHQRTCSELAARLSEKRKEVGKKIDKAIVQTLAELGIAKARFETRVGRRPTGDSDRKIVREGNVWHAATGRGADIVEFFITTNVGEDLKPLAKVASGGEVSRIMLALKKILSASARVPVLIFDEIDIGVSGRIAQAVGQSLKSLSRIHQVVTITHLPQIAGFADTHYLVEKAEEKKRSITHIRQLSRDDQVREVARLMSGDAVTEAGLQSARELMNVQS